MSARCHHCEKQPQIVPTPAEIYAFVVQHPTVLVLCVQDKKIRVYSKDITPEVCKALKYAFEEWAKNKLQAQIPGTPWRKPRPVSNKVSLFKIYQNMPSGCGLLSC